MKLGDVIESIPLVHIIGKLTGCVDLDTNQLHSKSTCNQVRIDLNEGRYADAFYDRFFPKYRKEKTNGTNN